MYFGNVGSFDDAVGAPWWCNDELEPLITWWEIRGHHHANMMRILGALVGAMENLGPFALWWRNGEMGKPLIKQRGNCEEFNDLMTKTGNWALMRQWKINLGSLRWRNGQTRDPSDDKIGVPDDLMGKLGALDHSFVFKRFHMAPFHSFKLMAPKF